MVSSTFNAITYANKLKKAKDNNERAEIEAEELSNIINSGLATKQNLLHTESLLLQKIENTKNEMIIKLGSLMVIGLGVLGFILKH